MDDDTFAWCLFQEADADGSGGLDRDEIRALARSLGNPLSEEELSVAMREMDEDGGGSVEFDEFLSWYQGATKAKSGWAAQMASAAKAYMYEAIAGRDTGQFSGGLATRMKAAAERRAGAVSAVGSSLVDMAAQAQAGDRALQVKLTPQSYSYQPRISPPPPPRYGRRSPSPEPSRASASVAAHEPDVHLRVPRLGRRANRSVGCVSSSASIDRRFVYIGPLPTCAGPRARLALDDHLATMPARADPLTQPQRRMPMASVARRRRAK